MKPEDGLIDASVEAIKPAMHSKSSIETCETRDGLGAINDPVAELVIWQRRLPDCFRDWIDAVDVSTLPEVRILVDPSDLRPALEPLLDECCLAKGRMRDLLIEDVDSLVHTFADVTDSDVVDVRLERIEHDACWKFHRDSVEARLVTSYRGPATEWVPISHSEQALHEQKDFNGPLERLGDHDVALFKGSCAGPENGIVHRSPPINGTGLTRLLLCLNKRSIVSPDLWKRT